MKFGSFGPVYLIKMPKNSTAFLSTLVELINLFLETHRVLHFTVFGWTETTTPIMQDFLALRKVMKG